MQAQRHKRIASLQAKIVGVVAGVILTLTGLFGGVQAYQNHETKQELAQVEENASFWRIIAGTEAPRNALQPTQLAIQLRDLLSQPINPETGLPDAIMDFRAAPNDFGRVDQELGFDPFNNEGQSCRSCGPLNEYMLNQLREIKAGNIDQLVQSDIDAHQVDGVTLAPFGMPLLLWAGTVYLTTTTGALILAIRRDTKRHGYSQSELNWKDTGGSVADQYKKFSKRLSPGYFLIVLPYRRKRGKDYQELLKTVNLQTSEKVLRDALKQLEKLPVEEREETKRKLEHFLELIDEQVANSAGVDRTFYENEAEAVRQSIARAMREVGEQLELREASIRELESPVQSNVLDEIEQSLAQAASNPPIRERRRTRPR